MQIRSLSCKASASDPPSLLGSAASACWAERVVPQNGSARGFNDLRHKYFDLAAGCCGRQRIPSICAAMPKLLFLLITLLVRGLRVALRARSDLVLENVALKQQVEALKQKRPRPQLDDADRAFWVAMRRAWSGWADRLVACPVLLVRHPPRPTADPSLQRHLQPERHAVRLARACIGYFHQDRTHLGQGRSGRKTLRRARSLQQAGEADAGPRSAERPPWCVARL